MPESRQRVIQTAIMLSSLVAIYGTVIVVLVRLFRRYGTDVGRAILAAFLSFGVAAGILATVLWPNDSSGLVNFPAVWLGDWIYVQAIGWIGNPYSNQAHYTIPWIFRVPQVYVLASVGLGALVGLGMKWVYKH